jgi:hypothetical protein
METLRLYDSHMNTTLFLKHVQENNFLLIVQSQEETGPRCCMSIGPNEAKDLREYLFKGNQQ